MSIGKLFQIAIVVGLASSTAAFAHPEQPNLRQLTGERAETLFHLLKDWKFYGEKVGIYENYSLQGVDCREGKLGAVSKCYLHKNGSTYSVKGYNARKLIRTLKSAGAPVKRYPLRNQVIVRGLHCEHNSHLPVADPSFYCEFWTGPELVEIELPEPPAPIEF